MEVMMIKIQIDGKHYETKAGKNLLETCLALGVYIPHFCFHPALCSVGACRLCAVKRFKDADDKRGKIIMSCMEPVTDGMIISVEDEEARVFRAAIIESLMTNHPHDCPVCDEGGECHLQDMTIMTGHNYRKFDFKKRTYNNQELGPFIKHEMNRCIQCYRCVRFYRDYAGGKDLHVFASRNHVYFGRHENGILQNEFSGNLVEVCPTGVFTDKPFSKHFTRKWDLSNAPSVCVHCSVGCNTIACERYGSLRRIMSRYNGAVNGYFICDRGRFGYDFVNDEKRILDAKLIHKIKNIAEVVDKDTLNSALQNALAAQKRIIGIGSPRASLESNFVLRELVGEANFFQGVTKKEQELTKIITTFLQNTRILSPSLKQIETADAILVLGEDITNSAPMMALALRQAIRNKANHEAERKGIPLWNDLPVRVLAQDDKSPVYIVTPSKDKLDEIAKTTCRASYSEIAELGSAVTSAIDSKAPNAICKSKVQQELAIRISETLKGAENPLIVTGVSSGDMQLVQAAINIAIALSSGNSNVMFTAVLPECNSMGLAQISGKPLDDLITLSALEEIDTLIILENDLYRRAASTSVDKLFKQSKQIIVIDHTLNKTSQQADIILPASTFAESEGTLVNNEGRTQRYYKVFPGKEDIKESWRWIGDLIRIKENMQTPGWQHFDDVVSDMIKKLPLFADLKDQMPDADYRMLNTKIPRQTMRYSGRTSMNANKTVGETNIHEDYDSPLAFSMEGQAENPPSSLVPFYWTPGWNSVQAMYNYLDEPNGSMKGGDPGIRLFEPKSDAANPYFILNPLTERVIKDEWRLVPVFRIFGSDELSSMSTSIAQRIEEPSVYLNKKDMDHLGVAENEQIKLIIGNTDHELKIKTDDSLQQGIAGVTINLPGMEFIDLPATGTFIKK